MDLTFFLIGAPALVGGAWIWQQVRHAGRTFRLIEQLRSSDPYYLSERWHRILYQWDITGNGRERWRRGVLIVSHKRIAVYPHPPPEDAQPLLTIQPHELRGFWRPQKYTDGDNDLWIHARINDQWRILRLRLWRYEMQKLVRAMKAVSSAEEVTAYRRRRPYLHRGPVKAHPATQNLQGAWELDAPVELYLMPLYLVVLRDNRVLDEILLADVQNIAALKRMEGGKPDGLLRFELPERRLAFALDPYEQWALDLAEAAKRTLEEPPQRKRKGKDDEDEDEDF